MVFFEEKGAKIYMGNRKLAYMIFVTMECNFRCSYCYEGIDKETWSMNIDIADKVIAFILTNSDFDKADEIEIAFHGGEPLLNFDIIKYIILKLNKSVIGKKVSIYYHITTNASLLNSEIIEFIAKYVQDISVSIDGRKETNDRYRKDYMGNGTHELVIGKIKALLKRRPYISARMTINSSELFELTKDIEYLLSIGFKSIIPAINIWDKNWNEQTLKELAMIDNYIKKNYSSEVSSILNSSKSILKCLGGENSFSIDSLGDIYPCTFSVGDSELCCGNVFSGLNRNMINRINIIKNTSIDECRGCAVYDCCKTVRCKFVNKKFNGDYATPIPLLCNIENLAFNN